MHTMTNMHRIVITYILNNSLGKIGKSTCIGHVGIGGIGIGQSFDIAASLLHLFIYLSILISF